MRTPTTLLRIGRIAAPMAIAMTMVSAQAQQTTQKPTGQTPTNQGPVTFKAGVTGVTTDLKVFDKKTHEFVPNLGKDEFLVYEDGVQQSVNWLQVSLGGRVTTWAAEPPPVVTEGVIRPPKRVQVDEGGRLWVVFIDDLHIQPDSTPRVKQMMTQMGEILLHSNDLVSFVSTGPTSCETLGGPDHDLSHRRLQECASKFMGGGATPREILEMPQTAQGLAELHHRVSVAFRTAYEILLQLQNITTRRKAFVWISEGYDLNPFQDARLQRAQDLYEGEFGAPSARDRYLADQQRLNQGGANPVGSVDSSTLNTRAQAVTQLYADPFRAVAGQFSDNDLVAQMAALLRTANTANTTIYTVDPRGLNAGPPLSEVKIGANEWATFIQKSVSGLQVLAEQTGGYAGVNNNDFPGIFRKIDNLSSDYYVIGWNSTNPDPLQKFRRINIKTSRPDVEVTGFKTSYTVENKAPGK